MQALLQEVFVVHINKDDGTERVQTRLEYLADDLNDYSPCPYPRDILLTWLSGQLESGAHRGPDAGRTLDIAYEDWINPDEYNADY